MSQLSRSIAKLKPVLILIFCLLSSRQAMAHDPGLSTAEIRVDQRTGVTVELAMAPFDIQRICPIDINGDQQISVAEFEEAKSCLLKTAINSTELRLDGEPLTVADQNATYDEKSSVVVLQLRFSGRIGTHFDFRS